jgi:hypothetical protein
LPYILFLIFIIYIKIGLHLIKIAYRSSNQILLLNNILLNSGLYSIKA